MKIININALYKELLRKGGDSSYAKVQQSLNGESIRGTLSDKDKRNLIEILEDDLKLAKSNILKS